MPHTAFTNGLFLKLPVETAGLVYWHSRLTTEIAQEKPKNVLRVNLILTTEQSCHFYKPMYSC